MEKLDIITAQTLQKENTLSNSYVLTRVFLALIFHPPKPWGERNQSLSPRPAQKMSIRKGDTQFLIFTFSFSTKGSFEGNSQR
jgi:hypothetical protein